MCIWLNTLYKYLAYAALYVIEYSCYQDEYSIILLEK